jgi:hypothetical protein
MGRPSRWFGAPRTQTLPNEGGTQRLASAHHIAAEPQTSRQGRTEVCATTFAIPGAWLVQLKNATSPLMKEGPTRGTDSPFRGP